MRASYLLERFEGFTKGEDKEEQCGQSAEQLAKARDDDGGEKDDAPPKEDGEIGV